jgi:hypothetical protein
MAWRLRVFLPFLKRKTLASNKGVHDVLREHCVAHFATNNRVTAEVDRQLQVADAVVQLVEHRHAVSPRRHIGLL